jgi:hypothetical protein
MLPSSWKTAGTSLFTLGLAAGALAYREEKPLTNREEAPREAMLEREVAELKNELAKVRAQLAESTVAGTAPHDPMRFALLGPMDLDRDGEDDRTRLGAMIVAAGGVVDYDLPPPGVGKEGGELKGYTGWYVFDDRTPFALKFKTGMKGLRVEDEEFLKKQSETIKEARHLGIRPMTIGRLLTLLGDAGQLDSRSRVETPGDAENSLPWWGKVPRDPVSRAILKKLEAPISMSFANETALEDVLKYIKSATQGPNDTGIPIYVDPVGLNEAQKTMTSPVSLDLEGVPLWITLRLVLKQLGLTYDVKDGLVTITAESSRDRPVPILEHVRRARQGELSLAEIRELTEVIRALQELDKASQGLFGASHPAKP